MTKRSRRFKKLTKQITKREYSKLLSEMSIREKIPSRKRSFTMDSKLCADREVENCLEARSRE